MRKQHIPPWNVSKLQWIFLISQNVKLLPSPRQQQTLFRSSLDTLLAQGPHPHSGPGNGSPSMKHCWVLLVFSTSGVRHVSSIQAMWGLQKPVKTVHCTQRYLLFLKVSGPLWTVCFNFVILNPQAVH